MTEAEWLAATDPQPIKKFLAGKVSDRKFRLLHVAYCRTVWELLTDERSRKAVLLLEDYADHLEREQLRREAEVLAMAAVPEVGDASDHSGDPARAVAIAASWFRQNVSSVPYWEFGIGSTASMVMHNDRQATGKLEADWLRHLFGNPFRPVALDPRWLTETVVALAIGIYVERAFDRLPILADALEDAGCESRDVLDHCRGPGPHVRGCWVVDLLLGKA